MQVYFKHFYKLCSYKICQPLQNIMQNSMTNTILSISSYTKHTNRGNGEGSKRHSYHSKRGDIIIRTHCPLG